ncbi:MAG: hypothetical protein GY797_19805 [Deltaproteobacteria bacterium]|nr:hypothetical protein [Deltaproteobacteria bacterium]
MKITEKIIEKFIGRMSLVEKEELLEQVMKYFSDVMSPKEKHQLIERMVQKLLEGIEIKELLPRIMMAMRKGAEIGVE